MSREMTSDVLRLAVAKQAPSSSALSRIATLKTAAYLLFRRRVSLLKILQLIKGYSFNEIQKDILNLSKQISMTPAEIIKCIEKRAVKIRTEEQSMDIIYQEDFTYENLHNDTRFSGLRNSVMEAVVDLYLNNLFK